MLSFTDTEVTNPLAQQPGTFPMFNPETGQWVNMNIGMGMYPFANPFFSGAPMMRPEFFPQQMGAYRGFRGGYRGRFPRGRGRSSVCTL